ncbi:MAG: hypothetical protein ACP5HM_13100 [Anaerolineae bacterium]
MGFRVYQDWLAIINHHPTTANLPAYITAANTHNFERNTPSIQNYPTGWLTSAHQVVNQEPQIHALCWFLDYFPHDDQWDFYSLSRPRGFMIEGMQEFDTLLSNLP